MTGAERVETLTPAHVRGVFQTTKFADQKKCSYLHKGGHCFCIAHNDLSGAERVETLTPAHVRGVFQTITNGVN